MVSKLVKYLLPGIFPSHESLTELKPSNKLKTLTKYLLATTFFLSSMNLTAPENKTPNPHNELKTIVIDAGHSKHYKGDGDKLEWKYTLDVALMLVGLLKEDGYNVILTRTDEKDVNDKSINKGDLNYDGYVNLKDEILARNKFSEENNAYAFLSLHFDNNKKDTTSKTQFYFYGLKNYDELNDGKKNFVNLNKLNYYSPDCVTFAEVLSEYYSLRNMNSSSGALDLGVLFMNHAKYAALVELDNLANPKVKKKIKSEEEIEKYANNLYESFKTFELRNKNYFFE
ncbi:N-acetylmuramoyl-L-alanine amidase [archaeon]|nr:N-acetylmuramoyl-L-alanine amidase [archaeon]